MLRHTCFVGGVKQHACSKMGFRIVSVKYSDACVVNDKLLREKNLFCARESDTVLNAGCFALAENLMLLDLLTCICAFVAALLFASVEQDDSCKMSLLLRTYL